MSEVRTGVIASSSWPTATASGYGTSQNGTNADRPSARTQWPTPLCRDGSNDAGPAGRRNDLPTVAQSWWPTATTTDANASARSSTQGASHTGSSLTDAMRQTFSLTAGPLGLQTPKRGPGGPVLDPRFVEALMGCPDGWTVPASPKHYEELACELLETRSSRSKARRLSHSSSTARLFHGDDDR